MADQAQQPADTRISFTAIVSGAASKTNTKNNGGEYVLQNCKITTEGKLFGLVVPGTRTTKNATGVTKEACEIGDEVVLYLTRTPSTQDPSKMMNFFEISTGTSASQDDINAALDAAMAESMQEAMDQQ